MKTKPKQLGNYIDAFVKKMFGRVLVFTDFLVNYADKRFVAEIDTTKIQPVSSHYIGQKGDERIVDLVFQCPLKSGAGNLMAVIIFEHQSTGLKKIPEKLLRYISAIWDAERKEGKKFLSAPYFIVLRTGKKPHRGKYPAMSDVLPKGRDGKPIGKAVEVEYDVVDLPNWDFDALIGKTELRLAMGILHKMTGDSPDEFPEALLPLLEISDETVRIELTKELLDFVDKALKAHNRRLDEAIVYEALKPIFREGERTMIKSIFDEKYDAGVIEGEARGVAIGEARGEARGVVIGEARGEARGKTALGRNMVLTALRTKFRRVPKDIEKAVSAMSDPIALESLLVQAIHSETIDEFAEVLR